MEKPSGRSSRKCLNVALLALVLFVLVRHYASADIYDDFKGIGIDASKWQVAGGGFSQPGDGFLYFSDSGPTLQTLVSKTLFSSGIFTMSFYDYSCDNNAPTSRGLGSIVGLGLGTEANWVRIERGQVREYPNGYGGGYVEANWVVPGETGNQVHVNGSPSKITAGFLQVRYDGTHVTFFYRASLADTWTQMGKTSLTPGWTTAVPMFVIVDPGGNRSDRYTLSFKLAGVEVSPMPDFSPGK